MCTCSSMYINTKVTKHKKYNWRMDKMARQQEVRVTRWWEDRVARWWEDRVT